MNVALVTLALLLPAAESGDWILQPAQERTAERMVGLDRPELLPGVSLERVALVQDHVQVLVRTTSGLLQCRIHAPEASTIKGHRTEAGVLWLPQDAPSGLGEALAQRLRQSAARLRWKSLVADSDPERARSRAEGLQARLRWRLGAGADRFEDEPLDPRLSDLWRLAISGEMDRVRAGLEGMLTSEVPPPGAVSLWLVSGPPRPSPCADDSVCPLEALLHDLEEHRSDPQWAARWSAEPRVLALGARNAHDRGEPRLASALLAQALTAPLPDQGAVELAVRWGWGPGRVLDGGLPAGELSSDIGPGEDQTLPWFLLLAFGLWVLALWLGREQLSRHALILCALGAIGAVVAGLVLSSPSGVSAPSAPEVEPVWWELGRGTDCTLSPAAVMAEGWHAQVRCGRDGAGVVIRSTPTDQVHTSTAQHHVQVIPMAAGGEVGEPVEGWLRRVRRELLALEDAGEALVPAPEGEVVGRRGSVLTRIATSARPDQHLLTGPIFLVAVFCLIWLLVLGLRAIQEVSTESPWERRALVVLAAVAVLTHLVVPSGMVMVYSGYMQVAELLRWEPLRYGAGANWLYGPWLALLGADHGTVQLVNRLYGLMGLLLLAAWAARSSPRSTWAVAGVTVLAPILWRDHGSESILVGGWVMLLAALFSLAEAARTGRAAVGLLGLPCGVVAAMTRPEMALALLPLGLVVLLHHRPEWTRRGWTLLALAIASGLMLAYPHAHQVMDTVDALVAVNALPGMERLQSRFFSDLWTLQGLHVVVAYGPAALLLLLPLAWTRPGERLLVTGIFLTALAWMAFTRVDLPEVSTPRVHAPPWTLLAMVGGLGAAGLRRRLDGLSSSTARMGAQSLVVGLWLGSAVWSLPALYGPTNADTEEALLREAQEVLPEGQICLATLDNRDPPPPGKTHRFFPYYLFADRDVPPRLSNLSGLEEERSLCPDGSYALLGMRCYMHLREDDAAGDPPQGEAPIEACRDFRDRWALTPLVERTVPNHGDVAFPMYPSGDNLTIGLYKVEAPR